METIFSNDQIISTSYVAFFDLDRTITRSISGKALARAGFRNGLLRPADLLNALFLSLAFRFKLKDRSKIIDDMISWVKGIPESKIADLCTEVVSRELFPSVFREAIAEIEFHRAKNGKVVILSSALAPVCKEMAKNLHIDDFICSELEVKDGDLTGRPLGPLCFAKEKAVRLLAYCEKNKFSPSDAWFYSDSITDMPALRSVGNPVCINPDSKLKKAAKKSSWKILTWNS
jgi:HAD superfamily hydrolase (TIGR01490 family)